MAEPLQDLAEQVKVDEDLKQELQANPEAALDKAAAKARLAYTEDKGFYRIAIIGLVLIIIGVIAVAVTVQLWKGEQVSDWIAALGTTALGGLVGLFAPPPQGS